MSNPDGRSERVGSAFSPLPPDDPTRMLTVARPVAEATLAHLGIAGNTYTILLSGADTAGRFAFFGVPLGTFTLNADTGGTLNRTVAGALITPGETQDLDVVLSAGERRRGSLVGRVTEADLVTPHSGANVFVGKFINGKFVDVVAALNKARAPSAPPPSIPINSSASS